MQTPETDNNPQLKPHHAAIIGAIIVGLVAATAYGTILWRQGEIDALTARNAALLKQIQSAPSPTPSASPTATPTATAKPASSTYTSPKGVSSQVFVPQSGAKLESPLQVIGLIPGNWSFEAQFPVELQTAAGATIATGIGTIQGTWTTTKPAPFLASFEFTPPAAGTTGWLVLKKSNPSGLPEQDDTIKVPVTF